MESAWFEKKTARGNRRGSEVIKAINAITFVIAVATFLLKTSRVVKAIELSKECFILLDSFALGNEMEIYELFHLFHMKIYQILLEGYCLIYDYTSAIECGEKLLEMTHRLGKLRDGEGSLAMQLATLYKRQLKYRKAKEHFEKALSIKKETGNRDDEATCYGYLGVLFFSTGEYNKMKEYVEKALTIRKEIGDRQGIASCYANLGVVFEHLGEYIKAKDYHLKALTIRKEIGDRRGEATDYGNLRNVLMFLGEYAKSEEYLQKALAISKEIGNRELEASCYGKLGDGCLYLGEHAKSVEYFKKKLSIIKEIDLREKEAACYQSLGVAHLYLGEYAKGKEYVHKGLAISKEFGNVEEERASYNNLAWAMLFEGNTQEAFSNLFSCIQKCEDMRGLLRDNDQFKVSFLDKHVFPYQTLSALFCNTGDHIKALYVFELGRARALAELMSAQYFVGEQITVNPQSWVGIERIMKKGSKCTCLYISYYELDIFLWILKANKPVRFRQIEANEHSGITEGSVRDLNDFFGKEPFRKLHILPHEHCEDRSLFPFDASQAEDSLAALRLVEEDEEDQDSQEPEPTLALYYKMLIAPVADLLDEPEILVVPDRSLYKVPFAALKDESGKYLSETFRIRIVPSLTILKLIQERPADHRSETEALIVGDPDVSHVLVLSQLSCARKEAEMIGGLLGVQPLLGCQATKLAVLEMMHSASLIHFAAHGDAERGEIALAPVRPVNRSLQQEDYLLTMSDIAQVQLRAKLVVLSCCHSGRGQIKAEGVVGIARAFLGSGARSVLVALWAIEDKATERFMCRFYEHLVRGESASESLHQAMKWMRNNGFSNVRQWAPFMLIGDNVTFNFGK